MAALAVSRAADKHSLGVRVGLGFASGQVLDHAWTTL